MPQIALDIDQITLEKIEKAARLKKHQYQIGLGII
jgi:hypothetical protein